MKLFRREQSKSCAASIHYLCRLTLASVHPRATVAAGGTKHCKIVKNGTSESPRTGVDDDARLYVIARGSRPRGDQVKELEFSFVAYTVLIA